MNPLRISIGIPAYNEEKNIEKLLVALLNQKTSLCHIEEIWVITSGCTDATVSLAKKMASQNKNMKVLEQKVREGKSSAINLFLKKAIGEICILCSADILPEENTIEELCLPLKNGSIGMVGAHPIPVNPSRGFINFCVQTLWELHHRVALQSPKCGEMVAFRNVIPSIPKESPVDEASIETAIRKKGLGIAYAPTAIVHNRGPGNIREFFQQRRRINYGHQWLKKTENYRVGTNTMSLLLSQLFRYIRQNPKKLLYLVGLILLETTSRVAAWTDLKKSASYTVWKPLPSTKKLP